MTYYVGLDVSLKETHLCVLQDGGGVVARGCVETAPGPLAAWLNEHAPGASVVVLETGGLSSWLAEGLVELGVPAVIVDARLAKKALSGRANKNDANDAEGLAWLALTGWYRRVVAKSQAARERRGLLVARQQLCSQRRALESVARALLRGFGVKVGRVAKGAFEARVVALAEDLPQMADPVMALLRCRRVLLAEIDLLEKRIEAVAKASATCRRLMTVPGVGPMTALAFSAAIDDPHRFGNSYDVGAYLGLTPRLFQSGEVAYHGHISKWGDALARHMLYEAANSLLVRVKDWSAPKAWAARLVRKIGPKKARVALARKLAVILHRMWVDGTDFRWGGAEAAAT
jgi:transposase